MKRTKERIIVAYTGDTAGYAGHVLNIRFIRLNDELVDAVREQVYRLPGERREVVTRHDLQGESLSNIAQQRGVPYYEVTADRRRAFKQLEKALQPLAKAHGLDQRTRWYRHVGVNEYRSTWLSSTELLVFWREEQVKERDIEDVRIVALGTSEF